MVMAVVSILLVTGMIGIGVLFGRIMCKIDAEKDSGESWLKNFDGQALRTPVQTTTRRSGGATTRR